MKPILLLLLVLLGGASVPKPPTVRVTFSPLTRVAYLRARKMAPAAGEKPVFPVKKHKGKLIIPTATGNKVFKDKAFPENEIDDVTYKYLGFFPKVRQHLLMVHYWESSEAIIVEENGNLFKLLSEPSYSPSKQRIAAASRGIIYEMMPNGLQLFDKRDGKTVLVWSTTPKTWEPAEAFWTTDSTLCVKQERCSSEGNYYTPKRFTYDKLLIK